MNLARCVAIGLAVVAATAWAEARSLKLTVREMGTGDALNRVEVRINDDKKYTDKNGEINISIPPGANIRIYRPSFVERQLTTNDIGNQSTLEIFLEPAAPSDNEIVVQGVRRPETSRKQVSVAEAAKVAPGGDPAQIAKLLPGVQSSGFQPQIIVRGSGPNDSRYFIDNFSVPFIFHTIGNLSVIPDQLLSDVEFSSGGFGAQYGGATGGVVSLLTKSEIPERDETTEFRVNIPIFSSLYHGRKIDDGKAYVAVSARRSYLDVFLPLVLPKDMGLTVVPVFGDAHFSYLRPTNDGHIKFLALYSYDGLNLLFPGSIAEDDSGRGRFKLNNDTALLGSEIKAKINDQWSYTLAPSLVHQSTKIDVLSNYIYIEASGPVLHAELTRKLEGKNRLYLGSRAEYLRTNVSVLAPKPDNADPFLDFEEAPKRQATVTRPFYDLASWVATDQYLGDWLLTPGARVFFDSSITRSGLDPRLNARFKLTEQHALKAALGQYSQAPEPADSDKTFGNPKIRFIKSYHYVLGLDTKWNDLWNTDFQLFYKITKGLVRSDAITNTANKGELNARGFEAFIRRNLTSRLFGWLSYTYSVNREKDSDDGPFHPSKNDQTHVAALVGNYKISNVWDAGGRLIYHTGNTYTTVDDAVYNTNYDKYQPRSSTGAKLYNGRLPAYHEIDIFANRDLLYDTWKLSMRFGIELLALERPVQDIQYNYDYSKSEYFRGVPPIPYFELRGTL